MLRRREILVFAISLLTFVGIPVAHAMPDPVDVESFDNSVATAQLYASQDESGRPEFDFERARQDNVDSEVLTIGRQFMEVGEAYHNDDTSFRASFPVWGNWCGPRHGSGTPIDVLDRLCMEHDKCYASRGYFDCLCDRQLKDGIQREKGNMSAAARARAAGIYVWFSTFICVPH
ncbi:hypothetical protein D4R08_06580 [Corynebacterium xerosis]|nr:hypothetical protein D4R08_06580 [Corynebacterium xerosis]